MRFSSHLKFIPFIGLFCISASAGAQTFSAPAACSAQASSYAEGMSSPQPLGDEEFFTKPSGPPNIMFLLGNNVSMQDFPVPIPVPGNYPDGGLPIGCSDDAMGAGITNSYFNVSVDGKQKFDPDYSNEFSTDTSKAYTSYGDRLPWDGNGGREAGVATKSDFSKGFIVSGITGDNTPCGKPDGSQSNIAQLLGYTYTQWQPYYNLCQSCMNNKGYFRGPRMNRGGKQVYTYGLSGRFLNKYPPKYAIARKVISDVFKAAGPVRLGIAVLSTAGSYFDPAQYLFNGGGSRLTPSCDKALAGTGFNDDRPQLQNALSNVQYDQGQHGLGEALFSIGGYYADETTWRSWFQTVPEVTSPTPINDGNSINGSYPNTSSDWTDGPSTWIFGTSNAAQQVFESGGSQHMSMCFPCQVSSVIVLSDSTPDADNTVPVTKMDSLATPPMPITPGVFPPGGVNACVNFCGGFGVPSCVAQCDTGANPQGPDRGNRNFMDDVSYFLAHTDLRPDPTTFPGSQVVHTYTILFGNTPDPMLQGMAQAGLGQSYTASNEQTLEDDIFKAIADIQKLSTSGSSPSLANVQASGVSTAYIPRFHPVNGKAFWPGDLLAYELYAEPAVTNCADGGPGDLDHNGNCDGVYLIDANFRRIAADVNGQINPSLPGLYYEVDNSNNLTATRAVPFWSASKSLGARDPGTRNVFTVIDTNNDGDIYGNVKGADDGETAFTPANWQALLPYLGIANDPYFCSTFAAKANIPEIATDTTYQTCAQMLIRYVLGYDVLNEENATNSDGGYPWAYLARGSVNPAWGDGGADLDDEILGDIFHSPPVELTLPESEQACDSQNFDDCLPTIHGGVTPLDVDGGLDAYLQWQADQVAHKQANVVVVGANDGMLHVFKSKCWFDNFVDPTSAINQSAGLWPSVNLPSGYSGTPYKCDPVTNGPGAGGQPGDELFAFIPPDLLPKLKYLVGLQHTYYVDGAPMVRHIWVDGVQGDESVLGDSAKDNIKEKDEFRDVVVVGERTGGTHYFALDMTDPLAYFEGRGGSNALQTAAGGNRFLWLFPHLSDPENISFGQTWNDVSGKPPPIGPIRLKSSVPGALSYSTANGSGTYVEKWAVFLSGGNDPLGVRGRGIYVVDAWTGDTIKSFSALNGYSSSMLYPFAAAVGAFNWGDNAERLTQPSNKDFWDTATVGDTGGQLWTVRFFDPDPQYWAAGRALQEAKADGTNDEHRFPIFDITTNYPTALGFLRTLVGTGDRQHLHDTGVGDCGFGNLRACITEGCNVSVKAGYGSGTDLFTAQYSYSAGSRNTGEVYTESSPLSAFGGLLGGFPSGATACAASFADSVDVHIFGPPCTDTDDQPLGTWACSDTASSVASLFDPTLGLSVIGSNGGIVANDGGGPLCYEKQPDRASNDNNYNPPALTASTTNLRNRFMSVRIFENTGGNRPLFSNPSAASSYDQNRLSDTDLSPISFTNPAAVSTETGNGWILTYPTYDERDSSNPELPPGSGCIVWNTVQGGVYCSQDSDCCDKLPDGGATTGCGASCDLTVNECKSTSPCSRVGTSSQFTYSADAITGEGGCGVAFQQGLADGGTDELRRITCTNNCSALPPPAPAAITFIASDGTVRTAVIGATGRDVSDLQITEPDDLLQMYYDVPISGTEHDCRHLGNCP